VLSNHDVTRHPTRFGGGDLGLRRARAATLLSLALPGGAYIYQGEEFGLAEVEDLPDEVRQDPFWLRSGHTEPGRDGCRVPLPWSGTQPPFGFSGDGAAAPWLPQPSDWADRTMRSQAARPDSMLTLYREALRLRPAQPELGDGSMTWLPAEPGVLAFARGDGGFACVVNLSDAPTALPAGELLLASDPVVDGQLPPDTAAWLRVS
jgi:alpha-glucosidase